MKNHPDWYPKHTTEEMMLTIRVLPNARSNEILGWFEDAAGEKFLKICVTASPEKGKANAAVIKLLAKELSLPKSAIELVRGQSVSKKVIKVLNR